MKCGIRRPLARPGTRVVIVVILVFFISVALGAVGLNVLGIGSILAGIGIVLNAVSTVFQDQPGQAPQEV